VLAGGCGFVLPKAIPWESPAVRATLLRNNSYLYSVKKIIGYFKDVQNEMKKVSWPSQEELVDYTIVVIVFTIILAIFIFAVDQLFSTILHVIYQ
jgi:preprotein translocase subunit SecE